MIFSHESDGVPFPAHNKGYVTSEQADALLAEYYTNFPGIVDMQGVLAAKAKRWVDEIAKRFVDGRGTVYLLAQKVQADTWKLSAMSFDKAAIDRMAETRVKTCEAFKLSDDVLVIERVIGPSEVTFLTHYDEIFVF